MSSTNMDNLSGIHQGYRARTQYTGAGRSSGIVISLTKPSKSTCGLLLLLLLGNVLYDSNFVKSSCHFLDIDSNLIFSSMCMCHLIM
jgi:hypothetical protein